MSRPWGNEPAPPIDPTAGWNGGHNRSRDGTRSNRRYFHKVVDVTTKEPDYMGLEPDRFGLMSVTKREFDRPMRRAERKGVPGVPRGHGDKNAICF